MADDEPAKRPPKTYEKTIVANVGVAASADLTVQRG